MPFLSVAGQVAMVQLVPSVNDRLQYCSCTVKRTPEMREHFGSGWRMYDLQCGAVLIVMLGGRRQAHPGQRHRRSQSPCGQPCGVSIMVKKTKIAELPHFDMAHYLDGEEAVADYLNLVIEEGDMAELAHALGMIARARGMTQLARDTGLTREALYKALRPDAQPRFDTIARVCRALGVRLTAQPMHPEQR
jgi:probable addiction module antidote protein